MRLLTTFLLFILIDGECLGAIRFNPIVTNTPAGMTNVILDVAASGTNSWSSNSISAIRATGANYSTNFVGQLSPTNYNSGTAANATTFLRGDGTWFNPSTGSATNAIGNLDGIGTNTVIYNGLTSLHSTTNKGDVYLEGTTTPGDGKVVVIDQVSKLAKTASGVGITNGSVWATAFEGDGSLVTGLTNGLATVPYVTAATNAMNGANWTFGNLAGNGLGLTNLRTNGTAADGVLPASGSNPFSGWFTDNNGVPLWREFYYITNSFPTTLFFNITGNAGTATTATNAMLLSSTGIGLADTNWVLSQVASLGSYMYFGGPTNTFAITNSGETVSRTNVFTGSTAPFPTASTNSVTGLTLNAYVRHVISTNRFNVIEAGPVSIVTYPFRSGGAGTVSGHYEFYVVDCVSNIMYELAAGPVTVISATVPTAIQTSLSLTNAFIATNQCYFAIAFKMDSVGSGGPQLHWAHGGSYDAHVTFTRPLSSATINASQIVGVIATNNIAGVPTANYIVQNVGGVPTWASAAAASQSPWLSDINAGQFRATNIFDLETDTDGTNRFQGRNVMTNLTYTLNTNNIAGAPVANYFVKQIGGVPTWTASAPTGTTNVMTVINVVDYGADTAASAAANATAINNAIQAVTNNSGGMGGTVYIPRGLYQVASTIYGYPGVTIQGDTREGTVLKFTASISNAIHFLTNNATASSLARDNPTAGVKNMTIYNDVGVTNSGDGIMIDAGPNANKFFYAPVLENLHILLNCRNSVYLAGIIGGHMDNVFGTYATNNGVLLGTSMNSFTARNCYMNRNGHYGWNIPQASYSSFVGCASDTNDVGGWYFGANALEITAVSCGGEVNGNINWMLDGCKNVTLINPRSDQGATTTNGFWVKGGWSVNILSPTAHEWTAAHSNGWAVWISDAPEMFNLVHGDVVENYGLGTVNDPMLCDLYQNKDVYSLGATTLQISTNAAPASVTVGTTAPDVWYTMKDNKSGTSYWVPGWKAH